VDTCAFGPKESLVDSRWSLVEEFLDAGYAAKPQADFPD